jgi:hypothetical protein
VWAKTRLGRRIPLDPHPVDNGNVQCVDVEHDGTMVVEVTSTPRGPDDPRYVSHFATCPDAPAHRRKR